MSKKYGDKCPECDTTWTLTPKFASRGYYIHCQPCGKKAEDIPPKIKKRPKYTEDNYFGLDYQAFEDFLDSSLDDDDYGDWF